MKSKIDKLLMYQDKLSKTINDTKTLKGHCFTTLNANIGKRIDSNLIAGINALLEDLYVLGYNERLYETKIAQLKKELKED